MVIRLVFYLVPVNTDEDFSSSFKYLESCLNNLKPVYDFRINLPVETPFEDFYAWLAELDSKVGSFPIKNLESKIDFKKPDDKLIGVTTVNDEIITNNLSLTYALGANSHEHTGSLLVVNTGILSMDSPNKVVYNDRKTKVLSHELLEDLLGICGSKNPHFELIHRQPPKDWILDKSFCVNDYTKEPILILLKDKLRRTLFSVDYRSKEICNECLIKLRD